MSRVTVQILRNFHKSIHAVQLNNGLKALLVRDTTGDENSLSYKKLLSRLGFATNTEQHNQVESRTASSATIHICINTGMFSDPEDLQVLRLYSLLYSFSLPS